MEVNVTPQQRQQILQSPEFLNKFDELTRNWKPVNKLPISANEEKKEYISLSGFLSLNMDIATYREYQNQDANDMEWGMIHKLCAFVLNKPGLHANYLEPYFIVYEEVGKFVQKQQNTAFQSAAATIKVRNSIVK